MKSMGLKIVNPLLVNLKDKIRFNIPFYVLRSPKDIAAAATEATEYG